MAKVLSYALIFYESKNFFCKMPTCIIDDNTGLARLYRATCYTHRGDGTHQTAKQIAAAGTSIYDYFVQHGSLDGAHLRGINSQAIRQLEALLNSQP
jgi:hypothetical protein